MSGGCKEPKAVFFGLREEGRRPGKKDLVADAPRRRFRDFRGQVVPPLKREAVSELVDEAVQNASKRPQAKQTIDGWWIPAGIKNCVSPTIEHPRSASVAAISLQGLATGIPCRLSRPLFHAPIGIRPIDIGTDTVVLSEKTSREAL